MGIKLTKLPELSPENLTESESHLWLLLREREECILQLKDEIARLKGEKGKPKIKPSRLEPKEKASQPEADGQECPGEEKEDSQKLSGANYINTDDTSARHQGVNSYCTHIGNQWFAWFETTPRKNRINFLELLRGQRTDYVLRSEARSLHE